MPRTSGPADSATADPPRTASISCSPGLSSRDLTQIVYTLGLKYSLYKCIGAKVYLFGYMDPYGNRCRLNCPSYRALFAKDTKPEVGGASFRNKFLEGLRRSGTGTSPPSFCFGKSASPCCASDNPGIDAVPDQPEFETCRPCSFPQAATGRERRWNSASGSEFLSGLNFAARHSFAEAGSQHKSDREMERERQTDRENRELKKSA